MELAFECCWMCSNKSALFAQRLTVTSFFSLFLRARFFILVINPKKSGKKHITVYQIIKCFLSFLCAFAFLQILEITKKMSQCHCFSNLTVLFILIITQTKFYPSFCPRPLISFLRRYLRDVKFQNVDFHYFPTKLSLQRQKKIYRFDKLVDLRVCTMCSQSELPQIHPIQSQTVRSGFIAVHFLIFFNIGYS